MQALRDEYVAAYALLRAMGLLTVEHLKLGIETYDPDVNFTKVRRRAERRLRHLGGRPHPRALGAQLMAGPESDARQGAARPESLAEVLASIRALVSAETEARTSAGERDGADADPGDARRRAGRRAAGDVLAEGLEAGPAAPAPILDEESLRG